MPNLHALLSPSSSERWISCPASVRLVENLPEGPTSFFALEGTKAHALGELEASFKFGLIDSDTWLERYDEWLLMAPLLDEENLLAMQTHIKAYVDFIRERMALYPNTQVMLEQKVDSGVEQCWGTSDVVLVSPKHVEIIDLKYGQGIPVSAVDNSQLRLYAVGSLDAFDGLLGDIELVRSTVFQPRLNSTSTEELSADDLRAWRDGLIPIATEALWSDRPRFGPSESACRWCDVAGECRARMAQATQEDFGVEPDTISPEEMGRLLVLIPGIKSWCAAVEEAALRKAYSEQIAIPGWKVVLSGGKRQVADERAAINMLVEKGFSHEEIAILKLKGIGDLEKVIKAATTGLKKDATLESVIGDLVVKNPGKPALVDENDKRPAINPNNEAAKEFAE